MNDTLKKLVAYAGTDSSGKWLSLDNVEKLTVLIAEECATICDRFQDRNVGMQPAECAGAIRHMFGDKK